MNLEGIIRGIGWVLGVYLVLGVIAAIPLQVRGLARLDPAARGATVGFRLLITPGILALWPLLVIRWHELRGTANQPPEPSRVTGSDFPRRLRARHGLAWKGLAVAVPLLIGMALLDRPAELPAPPLPVFSRTTPPAPTPH